MSTKTSFKRIALVAAAALTLGGLSAVSANAAGTEQWNISIATAPTTATVGGSVTAIVNNNFVNNGTADGINIAGAQFWSIPVGSGLSTNSLVWDTATVNAVTYANSNNNGVIAGSLGLGMQSWNGYTNSFQSTATTTGRSSVYAGLTFSPDVAGTYVVRVFGAPNATTSAISTDWTVTVAAKAPITAANSTAYIAAAAGSATSGSDLLPVAYPKTLDGSQAAHVAISANNVTANASAAALSAVVTGPGLASFTDYAHSGRAVTQAAANSGDLKLYADGVAGVSTISIYSGTTLLSTKTVTYYGSVATFSASAIKIAQGDTAGSTGSDLAAIQVVAKDSLGNLVPGHAVKVAAADKTVVVSGTGTSATASDITDGVGAVDVTVAGGKYGKIDLTVTSTDPSITATATVSLIVSSLTAKTVSLSSDASSYTTGSLITLTESGIDANGLPVADGATRAALSTNFLIQLAGVAANTAITSGSFAGGKYVLKAFAPVNQGTLTFSDTAVAPAAIAAPLSVEITNQAADSAQAAIDAAQEATDAANAAYDAANNAMDSADAATAAAQDASDNASAALAAVTSLSATVAKLVQSVTAIATALASIKKKLGVK